MFIENNMFIGHVFRPVSLLSGAIQSHASQPASIQKKIAGIITGFTF
jgi:hypothetical protein